MGSCISFCSDDAWKFWRFEPEGFCSEATWGYWWGWNFLASHFVVDVRFRPSHFVVGVRFSATHFVVRLWFVHVSSYAVQFCPTQTQISPTISNLEGAQLSAELKLKPSNLEGAQLRPESSDLKGYNHYKVVCLAVTTTKWHAHLNAMKDVSWHIQNPSKSRYPSHSNTNHHKPCQTITNFSRTKTLYKMGPGRFTTKCQKEKNTAFVASWRLKTCEDVLLQNGSKKFNMHLKTCTWKGFCGVVSVSLL